MDDRESFKDLQKWETEMKNNGIDLNQIKIVLLGNRADSASRVNWN
jgi:hypothetical protein